MPRKPKPRKLSVAERIARFFEIHTEGHISAIKSFANIDDDQFRNHIAQATTIKVEPGFRITPIYPETGTKSAGWWTCRPTEHIMCWADYKSLERHLGEWARRLTVQSGTKLQPQLEAIHRSVKFQYADLLQQHLSAMRIDPTLDYVVVDINSAIENGQTAIQRV